MRRFSYLVGVVLLAGLLFGIATVATVEAGKNKTKFDMLDDFAVVGGASGKGEVDVKAKNGLMKLKIDAEGLIPLHRYQVAVTVSPKPEVLAFPAGIIETHRFLLGTDKKGKLKFHTEDFPLALNPGDYRLDFFVTHDHATLPPPPNFLDRDLLLRCAPAATITIN